MIPVLASLVLEALHNNQAPVIQEGGLTFGATELLEHAQTVHLNLCQHGLRPPDEPVIVLVENHPADFASFLGIWIAEGVAVPVHVGVPDTVLRGIAERTGARFIIRGASGDIRETGLTPPDRPLLRGAALVVFTSGSTGSPKGVVLGHDRLAGKIRALQDMLRFSPTTRTLLPLQITFIFGIWVGLLSILSGAHLRLMSKFTPAVARAALSDGVTSAALVPTMLRAFFADTEGLGSAPALRQILTGGEPLGGGLSQRITSAWPDAGIYDLYGLTETGSCDFCLRPEEQDRGLGSIGRSTVGVEFRIAGESADGVGELQIRTPFGMLGYLDQEELTQASFEDGYFRTGDLARLRADGFVELAGRSKDVISRGGNKIVPLEIDRLFASHPDVAAALTTGVPDPLLGERIHLLIVPQPGARLDQQALLAWASGKIEKFKLPDVIHFAAELPAGRTGKADRIALREQIASNRQGCPEN
jgi:acyl-CoA synthetase (AMP-forming)/AMP-acid ligase II